MPFVSIITSLGPSGEVQKVGMDTLSNTHVNTQNIEIFFDISQ